MNNFWGQFSEQSHECVDDFKSDLSSIASCRTPIQVSEGVSPSSGFKRLPMDNTSKVASIKQTLRQLGCETIEEEDASSNSEEESK